MGIKRAIQKINVARSENSKVLDLSLLQLTTEDLEKLMLNIAGLSNLAELNLSNNPFTSLPDSICDLKLTSLDLSFTVVTTLPGSIGKLSELTSLDLSDTEIMALPNTIGGLRKLARLIVSSPNLKTLPESIGNLENLTELDVSGISFEILPDSVGDLRNLKSLIVSGDRIKILPDSIGKLVSLNQLILSGDGIKTLPESIFSLSNLIELRIFGDKFETLTESIGRLEKLEELVVSGHSFKALPESINKLLSLTLLSVSGNSFTDLPESIASLRNLTSLIVSGNSFETLPTSIGELLNLTHLSVSGKSFETLPAFIGKLLNLIELLVSDTAIRDLPESLERLPNLEELSFSNTPLSYQAMAWLARTFPGRAFYNMAVHSDNQSVEEVLETLYKDKDEREFVMESLENCDLDCGVIIYGRDSVSKPAKEIIEEFLGNVQIHSKYERDLYGPPLKSILEGVLNQEFFSKEERTLNMAKMIVSMGDCPTPIRERLMLEAVKQFFEQEGTLSEMNQNIIEREAVRNIVSKLEGFGKNEKIEQLNGFVNSIYLQGAEKDSYNPNVRIIGQRGRLPSTTPYREFAFMLIQNNPELIKNFACLVCQTDGNNEPIQTDGMYGLDVKKIKDIKDDYITELGFGISKQQEQKRYLNMFPEAINKLLKQYEELYTEYFTDAGYLLNTPLHTKELKELLSKGDIVVKDEYEKYFSKKQSEIETFMDKKKNTKADLDKFTTAININERKNSRSESPDRSGEKQTKAIRSTSRL
jgi:Leucine-rich repeat (LRR) protein